MGRVWHCGFGLGSLSTAVEVTTSSGTVSVQSTVTRPGSSGFALRVNPTLATGFVRQHIYATDQAIVGFKRFAVRIDTLPSANTTICRFQNTANDPVAQIRLTTAGKLQLWTAAGTQIGSDSAALTAGDGSWHVVELKTDATGTGALECRADGTAFASGANSVQGQWSRLVIGIIGTNCTADLYFTDWACNDASGTLQNDYAGDGHIIYQRPAAAGDANSWLKTNGLTAGDSTNWQLVDETPPNDATDFIAAVTLGSEDMYGVTASGIGSGDTVNCMLVGWRGRNNTADAVTTAKLQVKKASGGTVQQGAAITLNSAAFSTNASAEPRNYTLITHLNPDGGAWTQALLDSMQVGAKITAAGTNRIQITAIWAAVDYTPSSGLTVSPAGIATAEAFGTAALAQTVGPAGLVSSEAFGAVAVAADQTLAPSSIPSAGAFGALAVSVTVAPASVASGEAFGQLAVGTQVDLAGIGSAQAFGAATVGVEVAPPGIASTEAFGSPALGLTVEPAGIISGEAAGTPAVTQDTTITAAGIASGETFGTAALDLTVALAGVDSVETFGTLAVAPDGSIAIPSIASAEAFGVLALDQLLTLAAAETGEAFGVPVLGQGIAPAAITSGEAFGEAALGLVLALPGVDSAEAFGGLAIAVEVALAGAASAEVFGVVVLTVGQQLALAGVVSGETFGVLALLAQRLISVDGIPSAEMVGVPALHRDGSGPRAGRGVPILIEQPAAHLIALPAAHLTTSGSEVTLR